MTRRGWTKTAPRTYLHTSGVQVEYDYTRDVWMIANGPAAGERWGTRREAFYIAENRTA